MRVQHVGALLALAWLTACAGSSPAGVSSSSPSPPSASAAPSTPSPAATAATAAVSCSGKRTPGTTEGPYFKAGSPARTSLLEPGVAGTPLTVVGHVVTTTCAPIAGAGLDFWQADGNGVYDNAGFRLRGNQVTKASGEYRLETVMPGEYPGRTQHIHVKVQAPGGAVLTTQLFFPGSSRNSSDGIFDPALLMTVSGNQASYDFVLALS